MPLSVAFLRIHQIRADLEQEDGYCWWGTRKDQRRITASAARRIVNFEEGEGLLAMHQWWLVVHEQG